MAPPCGMWDLSFQTRDRTQAPCIGSSESLTTGPPRKSIPRAFWSSAFMNNLALRFSKGCFQICKKSILFTAGIPKDTLDNDHPQKKNGSTWVVSGGLSDSHHSLRCCCPWYLREAGQFLNPLKVRAARQHLILKRSCGLILYPP